MEAELTSLCQSVLEDFNLVLFYLPPPPHSGVGPHLPSVEEEEEEMPQQLQLAHNADPTSPSPTMPDALVFKMVVTCLMVVHSLKRGGGSCHLGGGGGCRVVMIVWGVFLTFSG